MSERLNKTIETIMSNIDQHISTKKVLGEPVSADGIVVFPIVEVTVGMAAGAFDKENQSRDSGGIGAKIAPTALLVVQNGTTQIVNIKDTDYINKLIYMIPDVVDKILNVFDGNKSEQDSGEKSGILDSDVESVGDKVIEPDDDTDIESDDDTDIESDDDADIESDGGRAAAGEQVRYYG